MQKSFEAPRSVEQAVATLAKHGAAARLLAGGTDLLVQMRSGVRQPAVVVDVKRIPELTAISLDANGATIGAAVCGDALSERADLAALWPGLFEAAALIGSKQVQGRASIGGNLCNSSPAADTVPALIANQARCIVAGPRGRREVPAEQFNTGPGKNVLAADELLVALFVPRPAARSADAYLRLIPRTEMDIAVVGAGVRVTLAADGTCSAARIALGAVGPTAFLVPEASAALVGKKIDDASLAAAAAAASAAARPIDDKRGTIPYRKHVAGVLTRRAARIAADRAAARA
ncbi:MAG TPA: xanthine dehydrogenase family protein subunit M [Myxococcota bacterium]|nr:xanthine dehydrogenase family protein subunit M [Myxococcota bacterium]